MAFRRIAPYSLRIEVRGQRDDERRRHRGGISRFRAVGLRLGALVTLALLGAGSAVALASHSSSSRASEDITVTLGGVVTVLQIPGIDVKVSSSTQRPIVGVPLTLTVAVNNSGSLRRTVSMILRGLGPQLPVDSVTTNLGTCQGGADYTCSLGELLLGASVRIFLTVTPRSAGAFTLNASAPPSNATHQLVLNVESPNADLGLESPSAGLAPKVGRTARAGFVVSNHGPVAVLGATVSLTLPPHTRLVSVVARSGGCTTRPLVCHVGGLAPGESTVVVVTLTAIRPGNGRVVVRETGELPDCCAGNDAGFVVVSVAAPKQPKHR